MDQSIFELIHGLVGVNWLLDGLGFLLSKFAIFLLLALALFLLWHLKSSNWRLQINSLILLLVSIIVSRGLIVEIIRFVFARERPFEVLELTSNLISSSDPSFPSGHATVAAAIAFSVFIYRRRWGSVLILFAILISLSRVFVGVHWPSDILIGFLIGAATPFIILKSFFPHSN